MTVDSVTISSAQRAHAQPEAQPTHNPGTPQVAAASTAAALFQLATGAGGAQQAEVLAHVVFACATAARVTDEDRDGEKQVCSVRRRHLACLSVPVRALDPMHVSHFAGFTIGRVS